MFLYQFEDRSSAMLEEVTAGLSRDQKTLSSKYFYDKRGSELFEAICELDEYYLTRCELEIMERHIHEICHSLDKGCLLVELGSGSSLKTRLLLSNMDDLAAYVPVDISAKFLQQTVEELENEYSGLKVMPVARDFTRAFDIPDLPDAGRTVLYYPGSTIGNFPRAQARAFLGRLSGMLSRGDGLLIGVDALKDVSVLEAAYNDTQGITASFNKNILIRLNKELDANFDIHRFTHKAWFNYEEKRMEMHLISDIEQTVTIGDATFHFREGETMHTENSCKYSEEDFRSLISGLFEVENMWMDSRAFFHVYYLRKS